MRSYLFFSFAIAVVVESFPRVQVPLGYPTVRQPASPFDQSFDKLATDALRHFQVPGFSVSVVDGNATYAKGYGLASYPSTEATGDTLYFVGSTTKSFTAASILKLIEESSNSSSPLSLRSKITDFIAWKLQDDYTTAHATLEDALSHRTGMGRHDLSYGGPNFTIQNMIDSMQHLPVTREIREEWQYCNMMFVVLSQIIENLSGTKLGKFFKKNIWEPLGMTNTYLNLHEAEVTSKLATGYYFDNDTNKFLPHDYIRPDFVAGAGGIISSVADFAKYLRAMMHKDSAVLRPESYAELRTGRMITPPILGEDVFTGPPVYSLGWMIALYSGVEIFHHTGGVPGFATIMIHIPERDWAVTVMNNADIGGAALNYLVALELLDRALESNKRPDISGIWSNITSLRREILKNVRGIAFPDAPPPEKAIKHALPLDAYTGSYWNAGYRHINLTLSPPSSYVGIPVPSEDGKILHANVTDRTWPHILDFEHVNAEHFLVRWHFNMKGASNFDLETDAMRGKFEIGSNGKVARMGLGYEPRMDQEMIWFHKVD
jgi:CubicO group peptidase (beta-lactamase class C family)